MASAASPKRMVSSVFITLASPHRATVAQNQSALKAAGSASRKQHPTTERVDPSDRLHSRRQMKEDQQPSRRDLGVSAPASGSQAPDKARSSRDTHQAHVVQNSSPSSFTKDPLLPPPPTDQKPLSHPATSDPQTIYNPEVKSASPSAGPEKPTGIQTSNTRDESQDVCGFCRKPVKVPGAVIEALNRTYHDGCFQCRSCHTPLAGKQYYNKAGIPLCEDCYQASLELCWACGEVIKDYVMRALERAYHPSCFICTTCKQKIGEQSFAQGEVGEVYCLQDYYRKYAPNCRACNQLIIPKEDGTDSYTVQCLGHSYHENCYRCETCGIQLSPEPNERGCYPLDGRMLCKQCHLNHVSTDDCTSLDKPKKLTGDAMGR
ncbi:filamin-binding LIM protein 1 [Synchiropus splendidus]|uniref:filamin-binding LIM protein 1 n=1 Tax=Synchiropus splendidus TaxID=270530 RepID=UPI00237DACF0|nr:filamin-binding LIM protein 1 [Synchiropus splendidus]